MRNILLLFLVFTLVIFACGKKDSGTGPGDNNPPSSVQLSIINISGLYIYLAWTQNNDSDFSSYKLYRATSSGVDSSCNLITTISNQADTTYTDTSPSPHHTYYYRLYVYDDGNLSSSSNEVFFTSTGLSNLTIGIDPKILTIQNGSIFTLTVWIEAVTDLFGASFELLYDGAIITADSAVAGDFLGSDVIFFDHYTTDTLSIAVTRKAGAGGVSGYGNLAKIWFHALGTGASSVDFTADIALKKEDGTNVDGFSTLDKWPAVVDVK